MLPKGLIQFGIERDSALFGIRNVWRATSPLPCPTFLQTSNRNFEISILFSVLKDMEIISLRMSRLTAVK